MSLKRKAAIVGIGELKPVRQTEGKTTLGMLAEAARLAIEDAGLSKEDIDGLLSVPMPTEVPMIVPATVVEYLQLHTRFADVVDLGGATAAGMVWRAAAAIDAGMCETVLCLTGNPREPRPPGPGRPRVIDRSPLAEFEAPYGAIGANFGYALIAQRHMHEFGTTPEQLAKVAVDQRTNACANPDAIFYGEPITIEDVLSSPMIVEPLHMLEIVMPCAGAAAVIVTSAERARRCPHPPTYLLGSGEYCTHRLITYAPNMTESAIRVSAGSAFDMAGVSPRDVDLVSIYDCYTITVIMTLEDAGFCEKGRGGPFVEENDLTYRGNLPLNTHGGQLSFGQAGLAGGMSHITEAVRQLQGRAGERQLPSCELAFVNGNGGIMSEQASLLLGT
jgi:acetyl-CoA acetyltransferase